MAASFVLSQRKSRSCESRWWLRVVSRSVYTQPPITDRARVLCERIGLQGVSAHDGRHAWATFAVRGGTDLKTLQDAGGWNSIVMPSRYAASQKIANRGVVLGK
jgi:integrase